MGLWSVLFMSAMPVFRLLVHCGIGAYMSSPKSNVMPADARKHINKVVFMCFMPSLVFSNLAQTVTVEKMIDWWFMPINVLLCYAIGAGIGSFIFDYFKPPPHLRRLIIACCATGNSSNLPLVLISAICVEAGSPFGRYDVCLANGVAYVSYGLWMATVLTWTVVFNYLKPPPEPYEQVEGAPMEDRNSEPASTANGTSSERETLSVGFQSSRAQTPQGLTGFQLGGVQTPQGGGFQGPTGLSRRASPSPFFHPASGPGFQEAQGFPQATAAQNFGFQGSQSVGGGVSGFQAPQGFREAEGFAMGPQVGSFQSFQPVFQDYRDHDLAPQGFINAPRVQSSLGQSFQTFQPRPPLTQRIQSPQLQGDGLQGTQPFQQNFLNQGFQGTGTTGFQGTSSAGYEMPQRQGFQVPQFSAASSLPIQAPQKAGTALFQDFPASQAAHGPQEFGFRELADDFSLTNLMLLAERLRLKEAFTPPTTAAAIAIPIGAVPAFRSLLYGHEAPLRFVGDALSILGEAMIPCMNILLGGNLSQGFGASELQLEVVIAIMLTRLLLLPLSGLIVVKLAAAMGMVPADPLFHFVLLLQFTMPTAINIGTMTQLFGVGQAESSIILFWCYTSSVVFLTLWTMIFLVLLI